MRLDVLLNSKQARRRLDTVDYNGDHDPSLLLVRPRVRMPIIRDKHGLAGLNRASERLASRVPRLSMLVRFEQEHARRLSRVRRRFFVALAVVFLIGVGGGIAIRSPEALRRTGLFLRGVAVRVSSYNAHNPEPQAKP